MPFAGTTFTSVERSLTTIPGAFVTIRRMTYGQKLERQSQMKLAIDMNNKSRDIKGELAMASRETTYSDFANCIVDHNLFKDESETIKFDFRNRADVDMLDPRVGEEIDKYINELNNFEESEEGKN